MAAPLVVRDVTIGVLVIQTVNPRHFSATDVEMLQTCGQLLAPVVLNARLLDLVATPDEERGRFVEEMARSGVVVVAEQSQRDEQNVALRGTSVSTGIAIGPVFCSRTRSIWRHFRYTASGDPQKEHGDLLRALAEARRDLDEVIGEVGESLGPEFASVFNTHVQILEDHGFSTGELSQQTADLR